jgi:hypothetical protein
LSIRTRPGRPQRTKVRRNIARFSAAWTCSQRRSGGKFGGQDRPRGLIGDRQPADASAGSQRHILDGVDLPDLVGEGRLAGQGGGHTAAPGPMDAGADEGDLEAPPRGDGGAIGVLAELQPQMGWSCFRSQAMRVSSRVLEGTGHPRGRESGASRSRPRRR